MFLPIYLSRHLNAFAATAIFRQSSAGFQACLGEIGVFCKFVHTLNVDVLRKSVNAFIFLRESTIHGKVEFTVMCRQLCIKNKT